MTDELEECWASVRSAPLVLESRTSKIQKCLDQACAKASENLHAILTELYEGKAATPQVMSEILSEIVSKGGSLFLQELKEVMRQQNLTGLIEVILENECITTDELVLFIQALPNSFLKQICNSVIGSATGIHGLIAIEFGRRNNTVARYSVARDGAHTYVDLETTTNKEFRFYLDENFDLSEDIDGTGV